jgi:hypothetical protein
MFKWSFHGPQAFEIQILSLFFLFLVALCFELRAIMSALKFKFS